MSLSPTNARLRHFSPEYLATIVILAAYVIWVLSLPVWPSQDGPVHLYYAHILGKLLSHSDPNVAQYFRVRHLMPPYAVYYYLLLVFSRFLPILMADRLVVCIYLVSFVFGFRYLARLLGRGADTTTLLATLLLLNWPLGMGFVNFCLSISIALWAIGLWLRLNRRRDFARRIGFLLLTVLMMLTHPVPLLLMLAVCWILLGVEWLKNHRAACSPRSTFLDLMTLTAGSLTIFYVKLFTIPHPLQNVLPERGSFFTRLMHRVSSYALEHGLALVFGTSGAVREYRASLAILLLAVIVIGVRRFMRFRSGRDWQPADTLFVLGLILLCTLPFIPPDLNGLFYFADRLPLLVWLTLLLGVSTSCFRSSQSAGRLNVERQVRMWLIAFAIVSNGALLFAANAVLRPAARSIAAVEHSPVTLQGRTGFIMEDPRPTTEALDVPAWDPYYWATINVVRHNEAVLANAPWMDETILPIGPASALPEEHVKALQTPVPNHLYGVLAASSEERSGALDAVSFVVIQQHGRAGLASVDDWFLDFTAGGRTHWTCRAASENWYRICVH